MQIQRSARQLAWLNTKREMDRQLADLIGSDLVSVLALIGVQNDKSARQNVRRFLDHAPIQKNGLTSLSLQGLSRQAGANVSDLRRIYEQVQPAAFPLSITKKGRRREVFVPTDQFRPVIDWIYSEVVSPMDRLNHNFAHAYRTATLRSTVSCMRPHTASDWFIKMDIHDFFGSVTDGMVRNSFLAAGHSTKTSSMLARLTTLERQGERTRFLPQGYPTSGVLANLALRKFDSALTSWVVKENQKHPDVRLKYTRYSDDIILSGRGLKEVAESDGKNGRAQKKFVRRIISVVINLLSREGFKINPSKTRLVEPPHTFRALGIDVKARELLPKKSIRNFLSIQARGIGLRGVKAQAERWATLNCRCSDHLNLEGEGYRCRLPGYPALISGYLTYAASMNSEYVRSIRGKMGDNFPQIVGEKLDTSLIRLRDARQPAPERMGAFQLDVEVDVDSFGQTIPRLLLAPPQNDTAKPQPKVE